MSRRLPQIVGIVGGSCAGKTWLADNLQKRLGRGAARLSQDDFYLDRAHLSLARRGRVNFDHPRAIDWRRLEQALSRCASGQSALVPRYDFATHSRLELDQTVEPAPVILVEGLWLFRRLSLRRLFDLKIYIRGASELCAQRRLQRDTQERGRSLKQAEEQWRTQTEPMFHRYVAPQERWADLVLETPISQEQVDRLAERLAPASTHFVGI